MKKPVAALVFLCAAAGAFAQEIDEAIISPGFEYTEHPRKGVFIAYASGAVEGSYYYMLPTNAYVNPDPDSALPNGECRYFDPVPENPDNMNGIERRIGEQVVGYRGDNTFAFLQSTNPAFTRFRTVSPCFDGRSGEQTEQQHRTFAYGAGSTVVSATKGKVYLTVNRTRIRKRWDSTSPYELASNGAEWIAGDFDQIFVGARETLSAALNTSTSSSTLCRGELNPQTSERCNPAFAWKLVPLVRITDGLVDPVDGQVKTFTALPPLLAEVNTATNSLPIFSGIGSQGAVLFGFMEFGNICTSWNTTTSPPLCTTQYPPALPSRVAAVFLTDTSTGLRPTSARLYFKKGSSWIAMNADGTFPTVPDDFAGTLGLSSISDVKFNPINATWNLWGDEWLDTDATTPGCEDDVHQPNDPFPNKGTRLAFVDLATHAKTTFWPSRNESGRWNPLAHYVYSSACNCLREFIFYSSTDYACYNLGTVGRAHEVVVRRWLDGAPDQLAPTPRFTFTCSLLSCSFDASSSTDDTGILDYSWTFGDSGSGGGQMAGHGYGATGAYVVTLTVTDLAGLKSSTSKLVSVTNEAPAAAEGFFTVPPCRIADTRATTPLTTGVHRIFQVAGLCGIPASAKAVSFNATVVSPTGSGHLVFFPGNQTSGPFAHSTLDFNPANSPRANNGIARLATNGAGSIDVAPFVTGSPGQVHLILDVFGYFSEDPVPAPGAQGPFGFQTVPSCRIADTRTGPPITVPAPRSFAVQGACGVPFGAAAAALNLTVIGPTAAGHASIYQAGPIPPVPNLNFNAGAVLANGARTRLASTTPDISVNYYSPAGDASMHAVIDVYGYFKPDAPLKYRPITACRAADTRFAERGAPALAGGESRSFQIRGNCGVPLSAKAVAVNLSAIGPAGPGFLVAYPSGAVMPGTSIVNYDPGQGNLGNGAIVPLSLLANDLTITAGVSSTHVVIDVLGYFQ